MNKENTRKGLRHYSPNVVYVLLIDGKYYVGCHTVKREYLTENDIKDCSGNYLRNLVMKHQITIDEYNRRTQVIRIEECSSKEEALNLEPLMIKEYKDYFKENCLNKALYGNAHGTKGIPVIFSEETKRKIGDKSRGRKHSEGTKVKISNSKRNQNCVFNHKYIRDNLTGKVYFSTKECCKENNLCFSRFKEYVETNYKGYGRYEYI